MIASLRRRHYRIISTFAVVIPIVFVAGLAVRSEPVTDRLPVAFQDMPGMFDLTVLDTSEVVKGISVGVRVSADALPPQNAVLELTPERDLQVANGVVYWSPGRELGDAFFLGALRGLRPVRFPLPTASFDQDGYVILYSVPRQEVVTAFSLALSGRTSAGAPRGP